MPQRDGYQKSDRMHTRLLQQSMHQHGATALRERYGIILRDGLGYKVAYTDMQDTGKGQWRLTLKDGQQVLVSKHRFRRISAKEFDL